MAEPFLQNFRVAWPALRRSPAFTTTAVDTLAVGIGANCAIFTGVKPWSLSIESSCEPTDVE